MWNGRLRRRRGLHRLSSEAAGLLVHLWAEGALLAGGTDSEGIGLAVKPRIIDKFPLVVVGLALKLFQRCFFAGA